VGVSSLFSVIYVSPAFAHANDVTVNAPDSSLLVGLRRGSADLDRFFREMSEAGLGEVDVPFTEKVQTAGIQKSMRFETQALWAMAALIGLAAVAVLGQALARQTYIDSDELPTLRAIGMARRALFALGISRATVIGLAAAVASVPVAILLSPLTPVGLARLAEPRPGLWIDGPALVIGAALVLLLTLGVTVLPVLRAARSATGSRNPPHAARSVLAGALRRSSSSPVIGAGVGMALEPGRGRTAVPVRSTIFGAALSVVALTASLVFGSSLSHVLDTPRLSGFTWDALVAVDDPGAALAARSALRADRRVDDFARGGYINVKVGGTSVFGLVIDRPSSVRPVIAAGRPPSAADEVALAIDTMRATHASIGDTVEVVLDDSQAHPRPVRMTIVGRAVIPPAPFGISKPGDGLALSAAGWIRVDPSARRGRNAPFLVRFAPGVAEATGLTAMREDAPTGFIAPAERPGDVSSLSRISDVPVLLASLLAVLAIGTLAHTLITGISRRRRDLAILETLGFVGRQLRGAVAWQATTLTLFALLIGLPLGIALGRWGWTLFADQLGVLPVPVVPPITILIAVPSALLLANLIAVVPGRAAARTHAALVLRNE
jgi:hypothetical protein